MKILVVDDSKTIQKLFTETCGHMGYTLDFASSEKEALEKLKKNNYDKIFVDITLSGGAYEGAELLKKHLKNEHEKTYVISAYSYDMVEKILGVPVFEVASDFIPKDENFTRRIREAITGVLEDDFLDFDELYGTEDSEEKKQIELANVTHGIVNAEEFLNSLPNREKLEETAQNILESIKEAETVTPETYNDQKDLIIEVVEDFELLITNHTCLEMLFNAVDELITLIEETNIEDVPEEKKDKFINYLLAIMFEIEDWIKNVFIEKTAKDVAYINASILNSVYELKKVIQREE
jgi:CheY-like chemotaxis protein